MTSFGRTNKKLQKTKWIRNHDLIKMKKLCHHTFASNKIFWPTLIHYIPYNRRTEGSGGHRPLLVPPFFGQIRLKIRAVCQYTPLSYSLRIYTCRPTVYANNVMFTFFVVVSLFVGGWGWGGGGVGWHKSTRIVVSGKKFENHRTIL